MKYCLYWKYRSCDLSDNAVQVIRIVYRYLEFIYDCSGKEKGELSPYWEKGRSIRSSSSLIFRMGLQYYCINKYSNEGLRRPTLFIWIWIAQNTRISPITCAKTFSNYLIRTVKTWYWTSRSRITIKIILNILYICIQIHTYCTQICWWVDEFTVKQSGLIGRDLMIDLWNIDFWFPNYRYYGSNLS